MRQHQPKRGENKRACGGREREQHAAARQTDPRIVTQLAGLARIPEPLAEVDAGQTRRTKQDAEK
jgi:hypothetical protein